LMSIKVRTRSWLIQHSLISLDELVKLHKTMVDTQFSANSVLSQAAKTSNDQLAQLRTDFAHARQSFKEQLLRDLEESSTKAQTWLDKVIRGMDSALQATLSKVSSAAKGAEYDVTSLGKVSRLELSYYS